MRYDRKALVLASLCLTISFAAAAQTPTPAPADKPAAATEAPAAKATPYDPALLQPATLRAKAPAEYEVKFVTTAGEFTVKVTRAWAPNGADRFYNLVLHHFYDGASFFRVLPGFMAQFGISAYPEVSKVWKPRTLRMTPSCRAIIADSCLLRLRDPTRVRRRSSLITATTKLSIEADFPHLLWFLTAWEL